MKRLLFSMMLIFALSFDSNANNVTTDCVDYASTVMEEWEGLYGCIENSSVYNSMYSHVYTWCNENLK